MRIELERKTVARETFFRGPGIHGGVEATVRVLPGEAGIWFSKDGGRLKAAPENVSDTTRCTELGGVRMVEHLLSAMNGAGITDAEVIVEGDELPILDGSARDYYLGLQTAGAGALPSRVCHLFSRVNLQDDDKYIAISVGTGRWRYVYEREGTWFEQQEVELELTQQTYAEEVAPARTFAFDSEIEALRAAGLGKGGTAQNTLVIGSDGYLTESRFPDEPSRHKLLDCMGDLYLSGIPYQFLNVVAERTGHKMNIEAAARLAEICEWED